MWSRILTFLTSRDFYDIIYSIDSHECSRFVIFIEGQEEPTFPGRPESPYFPVMNLRRFKWRIN